MVNTRSAFIDLAGRAAFPTLCAAIIVYFVFHAVAGTSGVLAWRDYAAEKRTLAARAGVVAAQRQALEHQSALLDPRHVDPDLADELVRRNLGVVGPDEVVVALPKAD